MKNKYNLMKLIILLIAFISIANYTFCQTDNQLIDNLLYSEIKPIKDLDIKYGYFSHDSKNILGEGSNGEFVYGQQNLLYCLYSFNLENMTGKKEEEFQISNRSKLICSPNRKFFSYMDREKRTTIIYNLEKNKVERTCKKWFTSEFLSSTGNFLIHTDIGYSTKTLKYIWFTDTLNETRIYYDCFRDFTYCISPDNKYIFISNNNCVPTEVLTIGNWKNRVYQDYDYDADCVSFSPDGKYLIYAEDNKLKTVNTKTWEKYYETKINYNKEYREIIFFPNGLYFLAITIDENVSYSPITVLLYKTETGEKIAEFPLDKRNFFIDISPNSQYLLIGNSLFNATDFLVFAYYKKNILEDISLKKELFAIKDEFETTTEYETRVAEATLYVNEIKTKYKDILKQKIDEENILRINNLKEKIKNSYTKEVLNISNLGAYNADNETFPITISILGTWNIKIPRNEAKSFKENYNNAKVIIYKQLLENGLAWDYFNMNITHPTTGSVYIFGKQKKALYLD